MSSHANRLGGLMHHPELIAEHREMLERKMNRVILGRKIVEYSGCAFFLIHMVNNRLKINKTTGLFIAIPPTISYLVKVMGYFWVDNYAKRSGLYKIYKISTF